MVRNAAVLLQGIVLVMAMGMTPIKAQEPAANTAGQEDTGKKKVVIEDDTTPKVKKGIKAVTDAEITTAVKTKLMGDKVARGTAIDVDTKAGVVTLSGSVPTQADKTRIGSLARRTKGVKRVENKLTVSAGSAG